MPGQAGVKYALLLRSICIAAGKRGDCRQSTSTFLEEDQDGVAVTVIFQRHQSFDYHGLAALHVHARHPLVAARGYIYTLDTTLAHPSFPQHFDYIARIFVRAQTNCSSALFTAPLPASNIFVFGRGVVQLYRNAFSSMALTKAEAVLLEKGLSTTHRSLVAFGAPVRFSPRRRAYCGSGYDPYRLQRRTVLRRCYYYEELGLFKFVTQ